MNDPLHAYNVAVSAARKAHKRTVDEAQNRYYQALAVIESARAQTLANAARLLRNQLAAAEDDYQQATNYGECRQTDACLCPACMARKFAATADQDPPF